MQLNQICLSYRTVFLLSFNMGLRLFGPVDWKDKTGQIPPICPMKLEILAIQSLHQIQYMLRSDCLHMIAQ